MDPHFERLVAILAAFDPAVTHISETTVQIGITWEARRAYRGQQLLESVSCGAEKLHQGEVRVEFLWRLSPSPLN